MCKLCDEGKPQDHTDSLRDSRRDFLKASTATAVAAAGLNLFTRACRAAQANDDPPTIAASPAGATSFAAAR